MKRGLLAFPTLAALVLAQVMVGVAHAGGDYRCHGPGYHESYGGYHNAYRDHSRRYDGYGYRHRYGNQHQYSDYGYGHRSTGAAVPYGGREPSRTWRDPTYGTGDTVRSSRSPGTDLTRQGRRVNPGQFHIPPGQLSPSGSCRLWYSDRPAGHQPPPGNCGLLEGLLL